MIVSSSIKSVALAICWLGLVAASTTHAKAPKALTAIPPATSVADTSPEQRAAIAKHLQNAQTALTNKQQTRLVVELEQALDIARQCAPLQLRALTVVNAVPQGLGMYSPAPRGQISGNTLLLYVEVSHFETRRLQGNYEVHLSTDASFFYDDGEPISSKKDIGTHRFVSKTKQDVTFMVIELRTQGLPAQPYRVEITVKDHVSGKSASARVPFTVLP